MNVGCERAVVFIWGMLQKTFLSKRREKKALLMANIIDIRNVVSLSPEKASLI